MTNFAFLWPENSSYLSAGIRELARSGNSVRLFLLRKSVFDGTFTGSGNVEVVHLDEGQALEPGDVRDVDVVVACGWHLRAYRRIYARVHHPWVNVVFFDTQWLGTARQRFRLPAARAVLPRWFDFAFVPGERQAAFAGMLGFPDGRIRWGALTLDSDIFACVEPIAPSNLGQRRNFLFAGRLVRQKGIEALTDAFASYRQSVAEPMGLLIAGDGHEGERLALASRPGVTLLGHLDPLELAQTMSRATALILPSTFEPYGVVLQEACAAGLLLVATRSCGASSEVLQDGWNGRRISSNSQNELVGALRWVDRLPSELLVEMGRRSRSAAEPFHPERWAQSLQDL